MHVYIHVPFCARRCAYCDFAIAVRREVPAARFVDAVLAEWAGWQGEPAWEASPEVATIYLGGGTPSLLPGPELARLLGALRRDRTISPGAEVTLEANPDDVSPAQADAWAAAGVNRVSLGVQSFDPGVLAWMHRTHDAAAPAQAMRVLREAGIGAVSVDLIFGLPAALDRDWARDLASALALEPEHLSLYGLTVEPGTPLARWTARGESRPVEEGRYAEEFLAAHETLVAAGFEHYEVSNYGRPGRRAVHNSAYWTRAPYIGLGPSAHSGLGARRRWNVRDWAAYDRTIVAGESPEAGSEELDAAAQRLERLYLGLRTDAGLPARELPAEAVDRWTAAGWAASVADRVRLSAEGWLRLDAIVASVA